MNKTIIWLRRNLRIVDNKAIFEALKRPGKISFCFVFDTNILKNFSNPDDRRLSFIARSLKDIDEELKKHHSSIHILYGNPVEVIPKFVKENNISNIFTDKDFEPTSTERDSKIKDSLKGICDFNMVLDHLLLDPKAILRDGEPYKVFTPFMKSFRAKISKEDLREYNYDLQDRLLEAQINFDVKDVLKKTGYNYIEDSLWDPNKADLIFDEFSRLKLSKYHSTRNILKEGSTSKISPYLRFGQLSIRKAFRIALEDEIESNFVNELIWREFYVSIMYHFPDSVQNEFQKKYIKRIPWKYDEKQWGAFIQGRTGFPVVDAAIRQLLETGWMHNRARMIVASFLTKNLFFDWRLGEKFFAEYLMDYELASNVGGWQWTASTGTDAQPYFRVFNPINQGLDYDPDGEYIRRYVPELSIVSKEHIHDGELVAKNYNIDYPRPIVDYKKTRQEAIEIFKSIG